LKILNLVTEIFRTAGGIPRYNLVLSESLGEIYGSGNCTILSMNDDQNSYPNTKENGPYTIVKYKKIVSSLFIKKFRLLYYGLIYILKNDYDIVFCNHVAIAFMGLISKLITRKPYFVLTYGIDVWGKMGLLRSLSMKNATRIITISEYTKDRLIDNGLNADKIVFLYCSINIDRFNPNIKFSNIREKHYLKDKKVLMTVGRLASEERYKGQDMVLQAMAKIVQEIPNAVYIIVGKGPDASRLQKIASDLGIQEHVIFAGFVPDDELSKYYNCCDAFIMPSRVVNRDGKWTGEGFGIVYLEANACGKPVIGGNKGGSAEAIVDGVTGILVDAENVNEIAKASIRLLSDADYAKRLGEDGRRMVVEKFNQNNVGKTIENIINEVIQESAA